MYPRWIEQRIRDELSDTRVVLLSGPRQAGKTTLAKKVATQGATYLTLDDPTVLVGTYDEKSNTTRKANGTVIGRGNQLSSLVLRSQL